jgi:hypothetical protein
MTLCANFLGLDLSFTRHRLLNCPSSSALLLTLK